MSCQERQRRRRSFCSGGKVRKRAAAVHIAGALCGHLSPLIALTSMRAPVPCFIL